LHQLKHLSDLMAANISKSDRHDAGKGSLCTNLDAFLLPIVHRSY